MFLSLMQVEKKKWKRKNIIVLIAEKKLAKMQ